MSVKLDDASIRQAEVAVVDHEYKRRAEGSLRSYLLAAGNVFYRIEVRPRVAGIETPRPGAISVVAIGGDDNPNSLRLGTHRARKARGTDAQSNGGCDSDLFHLLGFLKERFAWRQLRARPAARIFAAFSPLSSRIRAVVRPQF
jgi:hypothetical protein